MASFCLSDSMQWIFFSVLAWLSVTLQRHLLTLEPSYLPQTAILLRMLRSTGVSPVLFSISH